MSPLYYLFTLFTIPLKYLFFLQLSHQMFEPMVWYASTRYQSTESIDGYEYWLTFESKVLEKSELVK